MSVATVEEHLGTLCSAVRDENGISVAAARARTSERSFNAHVALLWSRSFAESQKTSLYPGGISWYSVKRWWLLNLSCQNCEGKINDDSLPSKWHDYSPHNIILLFTQFTMLCRQPFQMYEAYHRWILFLQCLS